MITVIHEHCRYTFAVNGEADFTIRCELLDLSPLLQDVVTSLIEVAVAYIALGRLGCPSTGNVSVTVDGPLPETAFPFIEGLLSSVMDARSAVAGLARRGWVRFDSRRHLNEKIATNFDADRVIVPSSGGMDSTAILRFLRSNSHPIPVFIEYDEGPDSFIKREWEHHQAVLSHLELKDAGPQKVILFSPDTLEKIPWNTDQFGIAYSCEGAVQDTDRWEVWGRDFALAAALLGRAIVEEALYIDMGHTKEFMFGLYRPDDGEAFYDRCCRSLHSILDWNAMLAEIFVTPPAVVASLRDCSKGVIGGYLLDDPGLFARTRSCIGTEPLECGYCFSCVDKISSILANCEEARLSIETHGRRETTLVYNGSPLASFSWFPSRENGGVWAKQLARVAASAGGPLSVNLRNSIYSPDAIQSAMYVLDQKGLDDFVCEEYNAVKAQPNAKEHLRLTHAKYTSNPGLLLPMEFLRDSATLVREDYLLFAPRSLNHPRRENP